MILVESREIVAAVRRSLEANVLPAMAEGFSRVQVIAAIRALDEVADRMDNGDPMVRVNERTEADLAVLAVDLAETSPDLSRQIEALLAETANISDPRMRNRVLGEHATEMLAGDDPAIGRIRFVLEVESGRTSADDAPWMCPEAIESLQ